MISNLSKQLNVLKLQENSEARKMRENERPSVLFNFKEAASISEEKISDLALEGFKNFSLYNPEINEFYQLLFPLEEKYLDREKLTIQQNEDLSKSLKKLLLLLSQNLKNKNVLKILELLIRKFEVHKYETEALIIFFMHYHSSPIYTKILQNIELGNTKKWYRNFDHFIKKGDTFKRSALCKILKNSNHIFDELADFNIQFIMLKTHHIFGVNDKNSFVDSKKVKEENEMISFRFFVTLIIEFLETNKNEVQLKLNAKRIFFRIFEVMVDKKKNSLFEGCMLLINYFVFNNFFSNDEISAILSDLFTLVTVLDQNRVMLIKLILYLSQKSYFHFSSNLLSLLDTKIFEEIDNISRYFSVFDLARKMLEFIICDLKNKIIKDNDIFTVDQILTILFKNDNHFLNSNEKKNFLFFKISEIFIHFSKIDISSKAVLHFLKNSKINAKEDVQTFIQILFECYNKVIDTIDNLNKQKFEINFKKLLKSIFGNISYYGLFEERDSLNDKHFTINSLVTLEGEKKIKFLKNLLKNFDMIKKEENKILLKKLIQENLIKEKNIELVVEIFPLIKKISFEQEVIENLKENIIMNIISNKIILNSNLIKNIKNEFLLIINKKPFMKIFDLLILIEKEQKNNLINQMNSNIALFFDIDYEDLLIILNYAMLYKEKIEIVFGILQRMIESSLKMKITKNSVDNYLVIIKKGLKLLFLLKSLGFENFKEKCSLIGNKIVEEVIKNLVKIESDKLWRVIEEIFIFLFNNNELEFLEYNEEFFFFVLEHFLNVDPTDLSPVFINSFNFFAEKNLEKIQNFARLFELDKKLIFNILGFFIGHSIDFKKQIEYLGLLKNIGLFLKKNYTNEMSNFYEILSKKILESSQELTIEKKDLFLKKFKKLLTSFLKEENLKKSFEKSIENMINIFESESEKININLKHIHSLIFFLKELEYEFSQEYFEKIKIKMLSVKDKINNTLFSEMTYLFLQFYLKSGDLINYLNLLNTIYLDINPQRFLKIINNYLHTSSVFIKIITVFKIWNCLEIYELKDMNLNLNELTLLFFVLINDPNIDKEKVKSFFVFFNLEISRFLNQNNFPIDNIIDLFCLLKLLINNCRFLEFLKEDFYYLLNTLCQFLNKKQKKFVFDKNKKLDSETFQNDKRNLNLATVFNQLNFKENYLINDFAYLHKEIIIIDLEKFVNTSLTLEIKNIINKNLEQFFNYTESKFNTENDQNRMEFEEENQNIKTELDQEKKALEEIEKNQLTVNPYLNKIKALSGYLILFMKKEPNKTFSIIRDFLQNAQKFVKKYKDDLISQNKNKKIDFENLLENYENTENSQNEFLIKIKAFDSALIELYFENLKLLKSFLNKKLNIQIVSITLDFLKTIDNSIFGGLKKLLHFKNLKKIKKEVFFHDFNNFLFKLFFDIYKGDVSILVFILIAYYLKEINNNDFNNFVNYMKEFIISSYFNTKDQFNQNYSSYILDVSLKNLNVINLLLSNKKKDNISIEISKEMNFYEKLLNNSDIISTKKKILIIYNFLNAKLIEDIYLKREIKELKFEEENKNPDIVEKMSLIFIFYFVNKDILKKRIFVQERKNEKLKYLGVVEKLMESYNKINLKITPLNLMFVLIPKIIEITENRNMLKNILSSYLDLINEKFSISQINKKEQKTFFAVYKNLMEKLIIKNDIDFTKKDSDKLLNNFINLSTNMLGKMKTLFVNVLDVSDAYLPFLNKIIQNNDFNVKINGYLFFAKLSENFESNFLKVYNFLLNSFCEFFGKVIISLNLLDKSEIESFDINCEKGLFNFDKKNTNESLEKVLLFIEEIFRNTKNFTEPFLSRILLLISQLPCELETKTIHTIKSITNSIETRIAFVHIKNILSKIEKKSLKNLFQLISVFFNSLITNLEQQTFVEKNKEIFEIIQIGLNLTESLFYKKNQLQGDLLEKWIEVIKMFSLKCNQAQLKNYFSILKKWVVNKKAFFPSFRKYVFITCQNKILEQLGDLGIFLYTESFDLMISFMCEIKPVLISLDKRNTFDIPEEHTITLFKTFSHYIILLCENDKNEFTNIYNFQQLSKSLLHQIENFRFFEKKELIPFFDQTLFVCFEKLILLKKEDYQIKDILNILFNFFHSPDSLLRLLSIKIVISIVKGLQEGCVMFLNDILPKVGYVLDDEILEVSQESKNLIDIIQSYCNENIKDFIINGIPNFVE